MKGNKGMTAQTKLLLIIVGIVAAGALFYLMVYKPLNGQQAQLTAQISEAEQQIATEQTKVAGINKRKEEIEAGKISGSTVEPYDNSNEEWAFVSDVMKLYATSYALSFGEPQSDGVYVRRGLQVTFTAANYTTAKQIIAELSASPYRNLVSNIKLSSTGSVSDAGFTGFNADNPVQGSITVTFFESAKDAG